MAIIELNEELLEAAVLGASLLGGGGRGSREETLETGRMALKIGPLHLLDLDDLDPQGTVVTCSTVSPTHRGGAFISPKARIRTVDLFLENRGFRPSGFIPNQCGCSAIVNGWIEGAVFGIPLVDGPCNGRSHPTTEMGSMGLHLVEGYVSSQFFAGGSPSKNNYFEGALKGDITALSHMIRHAANTVGNDLPVVRNPVSVDYVKANGAPGAIKQALRLGEAMMKAERKGADALIETAAEMLSASVIRFGVVKEVDRFTAGGIDSGTAFLGDWEVSFWKEYMTLERDGERIASFPDLITILDGHTGRVISSDRLEPGMEGVIFYASRKELILGGGMRTADNFEPIEKILGKPILPYLDDSRNIF